jgi:1,2-dihydroxy-3-keto-5-methylthiopentene dioxygenase
LRYVPSPPPPSPIKINPTNQTQGDQRLPHDSGRPVDPAYLSALGVTHYYFPDDLESVNKIAAERNYKNRDEIEISPDLLPGYEEKVKTFFHEHLHEDEEIRYILGGGGYFDVRSKDDAWVRLRLEKGDLMIMPAGIYHRFTTDDQNVSCCSFLFFESVFSFLEELVDVVGVLAGMRS